MNLQEFSTKLHACGLEKHFDELKSVMRSTIRLYPKRMEEDQIPIGQTKIGGSPDLPKKVIWPTETSFIDGVNITKPLAFIAQINLCEVSPQDQESLLPKTGFLYFFYSQDQEAWGGSYEDKNQFKVIYFDGNVSDLARIDFPEDLPDYASYKACAVTIESEISLPSYEHPVYKNFTEEEDQIFWEEVNSGGIVNKILGYSNNIQNEMELECELVTNGINYGNLSNCDNSKVEEFTQNAKNWRLLLQIDSNDENEMMWGDCGRLYFWIKKDDLLNKRFDQSWFILQCY